jgi:hypothetical protein
MKPAPVSHRSTSHDIQGFSAAWYVSEEEIPRRWLDHLWGARETSSTIDIASYLSKNPSWLIPNQNQPLDFLSWPFWRNLKEIPSLKQDEELIQTGDMKTRSEARKTSINRARIKSSGFSYCQSVRDTNTSCFSFFVMLLPLTSDQYEAPEISPEWTFRED